MMKDKLLIVFVKNPVPGNVKTRLIEHLGPETACRVYERLLNETKEIIQDVDADIRIAFDEDLDNDRIWTNYEKVLQSKGSLGVKMNDEFRRAFSDGYSKVCLIGSDILELSAEIINGAFKELERSNTVIGPAQDGGYYLIGFAEESMIRDSFVNIPWSTALVFDLTVNYWQKDGISYSSLKPLSDLDTIEDMPPSYLESLTIPIDQS